MDNKVTCHSGYEYAERPISFQWRDERLEIEEILSRWRSPEGKVFRVRTVDDQVFELHYSELADEWQIQAI